MGKEHVVDHHHEYKTRTSIAFEGKYEYIIDNKEKLFKNVNSSRSCWEQYLIVDGSLKNITKDSEITGFGLSIRINWYRSLAVTMIRRIELMIDGKLIPREKIYFQIEDNDKIYKLDEIGPGHAEDYWYLNKECILFVDQPGGLEKGIHEIEAALHVFITYHNYPDVSYMKKIMILE